MLLVGRPHFCLEGSVGLILDLAISGAVSIAGEVTVGLLRRFLWNELMWFLKY